MSQGGLSPPHTLLRKDEDSEEISFFRGEDRTYSTGDRTYSAGQRSYSKGQRKVSASMDRSSVEFLGPRDTNYLGLNANEEKEEGGEEEAKTNKNTLGIIFILMVVVGLMNKIFNKLETIPMYNYPNFLNLLTTFIYVPVCFSYIIPAARNGYIPKEQLELPKRDFAVMGALDAMAGIMQIFGATYLPGPLIILLLQAAIPISMIISTYLVKAKYNNYQYFGAFIVAGGIMIVLGPSLADGGGVSILWAVVLMLSTVPMTLSSVYKEIALGAQDLDPIYLNGWIAVFQLIFSIFLCIPSSLVSEPPVGIDGLPQNLWNGLKCYVGISTQQCGDDDDCNVDECHFYGPLYVNIYLFFNLAYNQLIILIIKYGSSNLLYLALTLMVPLGNVAFTLPFVPGHTGLKATDIIGLIVICSGLGCYRFADTLIKKVWGEGSNRQFSYDDYTFDRNPLDGEEDLGTATVESSINGDVKLPRTLIAPLLEEQGEG